MVWFGLSHFAILVGQAAASYFLSFWTYQSRLPWRCTRTYKWLKALSTQLLIRRPRYKYKCKYDALLMYPSPVPFCLFLPLSLARWSRVHTMEYTRWNVNSGVHKMHTVAIYTIEFVWSLYNNGTRTMESLRWNPNNTIICYDGICTMESAWWNGMR